MTSYPTPRPHSWGSSTGRVPVAATPPSTSLGAMTRDTEIDRRRELAQRSSTLLLSHKRRIDAGKLTSVREMAEQLVAMKRTDILEHMCELHQVSMKNNLIEIITQATYVERENARNWVNLDNFRTIISSCMPLQEWPKLADPAIPGFDFIAAERDRLMQFGPPKPSDLCERQARIRYDAMNTEQQREYFALHFEAPKLSVVRAPDHPQEDNSKLLVQRDGNTLNLRWPRQSIEVIASPDGHTMWVYVDGTCYLRIADIADNLSCNFTVASSNEVANG